MKSPLFRYAVTMADRSDIGGRVRALLDTDQARAISRPATLVALTALGFAAGSLATLRFVPHSDSTPELSRATVALNAAIADSVPAAQGIATATVIAQSADAEIAEVHEDDGDDHDRMKLALNALKSRADRLQAAYMTIQHRLKSYRDPRNPEIALVSAQSRVTLAEYENTLRQIASLERRLQTPEGVDLEVPVPPLPPAADVTDLAVTHQQLQEQMATLQAERNELEAQQKRLMDLRTQESSGLARSLRAAIDAKRDEMGQRLAQGYKPDSAIIKDLQQHIADLQSTLKARLDAR